MIAIADKDLYNIIVLCMKVIFMSIYTRSETLSAENLEESTQSSTDSNQDSQDELQVTSDSSSSQCSENSHFLSLTRSHRYVIPFSRSLPWTDNLLLITFVCSQTLKRISCSRYVLQVMYKLWIFVTVQAVPQQNSFYCNVAMDHVTKHVPPSIFSSFHHSSESRVPQSEVFRLNKASDCEKITKLFLGSIYANIHLKRFVFYSVIIAFSFPRL